QGCTERACLAQSTANFVQLRRQLLAFRGVRRGLAESEQYIQRRAPAFGVDLDLGLGDTLSDGLREARIDDNHPGQNERPSLRHGIGSTGSVALRGARWPRCSPHRDAATRANCWRRQDSRSGQQPRQSLQAKARRQLRGTPSAQGLAPSAARIPSAPASSVFASAAPSTLAARRDRTSLRSALTWFAAAV